MTRQYRELAFVVFLACVLIALCATLALAHSDGHMQYDQECCHNLDCAPVIRSQVMPGPSYAGITGGNQSLPVLWVQTIHGRAPVTSETKRKESKDARNHACIRDGKLVCIYEAPGN
jgi:hypothetical protein